MPAGCLSLLSLAAAMTLAFLPHPAVLGLKAGGGALRAHARALVYDDDRRPKSELHREVGISCHRYNLSRF